MQSAWKNGIVKLFSISPEPLFSPGVQVDTFEKRPLLPNPGVPDNRDLSTFSNFNPPPNFGGLIRHRTLAD